MNKTNNKSLTENSKMLRNKMTKEENKLWYRFLKLLPITVNRQKVIGTYIVDFYCASAKLIIELDGSQHYEEKGLEYDKKRTKYFESLGLNVVRYSNLDVQQNFEGVCSDINRRVFSTSSVSYGDTFPSRGR